MPGSDKSAQAVYGLYPRGCELRYGEQRIGKKTLAFPLRGETKESVAYPCRQYAEDFRGVYHGGKQKQMFHDRNIALFGL